ncbi:prepilin peptidase [Vibrio natriegens]|uniref:A24 family peptidase n=1 Tax=Vibrio natriegens TaxID=691 RepID=UPI0021E9744A|nr:A24 family peptidase [Vibrio natriegens]UYI46500.1 prepilin peptidase [Vibrio natriegens]
MNLLIWVLLFIIGVSDVQRNRIPNNLVIVLFLVVFVDLSQTPELLWMLHIKGMLITLSVGFALYVFKAMAGGDVKLLAVVGLWLGSEVMWQATAYVIVSGGIIGVLYLMLHLVSSGISFRDQVKTYAVQRVTPGWAAQHALVIPFAPAIVIGTAYYFYIH